MLPTITISGITLYTHLIANLFAAIVFGVIAWIRSKELRAGFALADYIDLTFHLFCGVLGGALVLALLPYFLRFVILGQQMPLGWWEGWQSWFGAVAGGSLAGWLYARKNNQPLGKSFDIFAPALPIALSVVRIGCLLAGDSQGKLTNTWYALYLPDPQGIWAYRYPTQPVDIVINLLIAIILFRFPRYAFKIGKPAGWPFAGFLYWLYIILFCGQRLFFERWRADTPILIGEITWNHLYCLFGLGIALSVIGARLFKARPSP